MCRLVLWNWVLEPLLYFCFIHTCNFRLRVYTFLFVFFDLLAGKAFLERPIKLFLIDNQQSGGVTVADFEFVSDLKPDRQCHVLYQSNLPLLLGRSGLVYITLITHTYIHLCSYIVPPLIYYNGPYIANICIVVLLHRTPNP